MKIFFPYHERVMSTDLDTLLSASDPAPVEIVNPDSAAPVLLVCEHAGRAVPAALGALGVSNEVLTSHRGWDIGAEAVARHLAGALDAPLVIQRYSRLVIDANRPPGSDDSMPWTSDGIDIPGNWTLTPEDRMRRVAEIFEPFDQAITQGFSAHPRKAAFSIHSYTPRFGGADRPWHAGFLTRQSPKTAERLMASVAGAAPDLVLGLNQPYQVDSQTDWFIPVHAETRGLPHCLIEIRNDQIGHSDGAALWGQLLTCAIRALLKDLP